VPAAGHMFRSAGERKGSVRSLYSGLVVMAAVALAFIAVALTLAFN
jgi:hypothetical protein